MKNLRALNLANEQITVADTDLLDIPADTAFSVLIWFKLNGSVPTLDLIKKMDGNNIGYSLGINSSDKLSASVTDTDETGNQNVSVASVAVNTWYLGILSFDADGALRTFLNGVAPLADTATGATAGLETAEDLLITDSSFDGQIGEVQLIVGHALSATEALDLYNRGTSKGLKGNYGVGDVRLWLRWKNRVLKDNSGYENILTGAVDSTDRIRVKDYR